MFFAFFAVYAVGFASGWAFFKHRADVKAAVKDEAAKL
jgi:hypothetical protein